MTKMVIFSKRKILLNIKYKSKKIKKKYNKVIAYTCWEFKDQNI